MSAYKAFLLREIDAFIEDQESDQRVYAQGNAIAARSSREVIERLNWMQACLVFRAIEDVQTRSGLQVIPVDYVAFARDVLLDMQDKRDVRPATQPKA